MAARVDLQHIRVFTLTATFRGFLKDGGSPMLAAWSQLIMGYTLMAARVGQLPIWVFTLIVTLRWAS